MISITWHIPVLQVIIPMCAALISALSFHRNLAWFIASISSALSLILSIFCIIYIKGPLLYNFGGWQAPIGIEYRLDSLSQPVIILFNAILAFFLIFGKQQIDKIIKNTEKKKQHIFYTLILFAHVGYIGTISTNDLFNLYVFIEISSLSTYILVSYSSDKRALSGALNYLIIGTIGATLILIGIGFLLATTGSLNITDIMKILKSLPSSGAITIAITFIISGILLKMALFPMHFWMIKAYEFVSPFILTYLAPITSLTGAYMFLRFMYFAIDNALLFQSITYVLKPLSIIAIISCTIFALKANNIKKIIIYSTAAQIGYILLLISMRSSYIILFQMLLLDSINKIALFTIITYIQCQTDNLKLTSMPSIENSNFFKILTAFAIIFSAGLPLTSMFLIKIQIWETLLLKNLYLEFVIIVLSSAIGLLYHLRFATAIFFNPKSNGTIQINTKIYNLTIIIILQIVSLLYTQDLARIAQYINSTIIPT